MKKLPLQWRITILTTTVLLICTVILTTISMLNVQRLFVLPALDNVEMISDPHPLVPADSKMIPAGPYNLPSRTPGNQFNLIVVVACLVVTICGARATWFVTGQALHPLRNLTNQVDTVDEKNLSQRLPNTGTDDEIGHLTNAFNRMLSRLDDAFLRQKRFTANAAHELKTPLTMLKTGAQVLARDTSATIEDYQQGMTLALTSADRLTGIVNDLLALASAEAAPTAEQEEVLLEPLFDAILHDILPLMETRKISCEVQCGDLSILGNPSYLYQAFFNLIENACKYGKENGHILIAAAHTAKETVVCLRDDGPGIPLEHLPYLFDAFYRVDKSRSRTAGGSGLGLSIVKTMIETCGGTIRVESDGLTGTCFVSSFPS